jgi:hypothetical protein
VHLVTGSYNCRLLKLTFWVFAFPPNNLLNSNFNSGDFDTKAAFSANLPCFAACITSTILVQQVQRIRKISGIHLSVN